MLSSAIGPFRADVMQKWYDDGYFNPDLLMKRTHADSDWTPVRDLLRLAGSPQLFLVPLRPHPPAPQPDPFTTHPPEQDPTKNQLGTSFEPVPRPLHGSPLGYLHHASNPDSPASQFSNGRFGNHSPETAALGRGHEVPQSGYSAGIEPQRHVVANESINPSLSSRSSFSNFLPGQVGTVDGRTYPSELHYVCLCTSSKPQISFQL